MPVFKPQDGEQLVVRSTIGAVPDNNARRGMLPTTKTDFAGNRPSTGARVRFGQLTQNAFFARHNPHPARVRHIKGLLDFPICAVQDDGFLINPQLRLRDHRKSDMRQSLPVRLPVQAINYNPQYINPPLQAHQVNQQEASRYYQRFPLSVRERADPTIGLIPYTDAWRDELISLVDKAGLCLPTDAKDTQREQPKRTSVYSADTGRLIPPPSRAMSRGASRQKQRETFSHIAQDQSNEALVLEMLCQILQTDSVVAVQEWLVSSGDKEKDLALNLIKMAIGAEESYWRHNEPPLRSPHEQFYNDRPRSQPPSNMIVENGYAEMDRPSPKPRLHTSMSRLNSGGSYSRYAYEGNKNMTGSPRNRQEDNDNPSRQPSGHKPDIFKVDHNSHRPSSQPQQVRITNPPPAPGSPAGLIGKLSATLQKRGPSQGSNGQS